MYLGEFLQAVERWGLEKRGNLDVISVQVTGEAVGIVRITLEEQI